MPSNTSVADILERAAALIEPEGRWTQDAYARNARGINTGLSCTSAPGPNVAWSMSGAIGEVAGGDYYAVDAANFLHGLLGGLLTDWNDAPERTQQEVVSKLREAAAKAREGGK